MILVLVGSRGEGFLRMERVFCAGGFFPCALRRKPAAPRFTAGRSRLVRITLRPVGAGANCRSDR